MEHFFKNKKVKNFAYFNIIIHLFDTLVQSDVFLERPLRFEFFRAALKPHFFN
jgi:hypothetical protein